MFETLIDNLIETLSGISSLSSVTFVNAFKNNAVKNPVTTTTICINFAGSKIKNGAFGDFLGENTANEFFGKKGSFTINFEIFVPISDGGEKCCGIFTLLTDALLFEQTDLSVIDIECRSIGFDNKINAFNLTVKAGFKLFLSKKEEQGTIQNIIVK